MRLKTLLVILLCMTLYSEKINATNEIGLTQEIYIQLLSENNGDWLVYFLNAETIPLLIIFFINSCLISSWLLSHCYLTPF